MSVARGELHSVIRRAMFKKKQKELDGKTPMWFKLWHSNHFKPVDSRSKRTEKWVAVIIIGIIGSYFAGDRYTPEVVEFVKSLFG